MIIFIIHSEYIIFTSSSSVAAVPEFMHM